DWSSDVCSSDLSARTLDTVIAPLTLSDDARAQSGVGLQGSGQLYARLPMTDELSLVPRASARGQFYRHDEFNDLSSSALVGVEWSVGRDRLTPDRKSTRLNSSHVKISYAVF